MPNAQPIEIWKPVKGWEGIYSASSLGRIRRDAAGRNAKVGGCLSQTRMPSGYQYVNLSDKRRCRLREYVHRIILSAFDGPPKVGMECNHKNGVRDDNRIENLEWVTHAENLNHSYDCLGRSPLRGERNGNSKLTAKDVQDIRARHARGERHVSIAKLFGIRDNTVCAICSRDRWKHI